MDIINLSGRLVRLEPLDRQHIEGLTSAAAGDRNLYQWSPVPNGRQAMASYVNTALAWRDAGTAIPFAIIRLTDNLVIGSTRFWNIERWQWPIGHPSHGREHPDACEIGYTWLSGAAIRTGANREAKFLMLEFAFERWKVVCVCLHTDQRNDRSRTAIERLGAKFEGVLRAHRMAADSIPRNSLRFSILADEWPSIKEDLQQRLSRHSG
jgi:RimJ/RimL family protein N-acetyltransferase